MQGVVLSQAEEHQIESFKFLRNIHISFTLNLEWTNAVAKLPFHPV